MTDLHTSTYTSARMLDTLTLWDSTHKALLTGQWVEGRAYLDALGQRTVVDRLLDLSAYVRVAGLEGRTPPSGQLATVLDDRLAGINHRVDLRLAGQTDY